MALFDTLKKITFNVFGSGFTAADEAFFEELEEALILADIGMDTSVEAVETLRRLVRQDKMKEQEDSYEAHLMTSRMDILCYKK